MTRLAAAQRVTVRRIIAASPEQLFDAWLDPVSLATWMRPGTIVRSVATITPIVGGSFEIVMHGATGARVHRGIYQVINRPHRLAFTWISTGTHGEESLVSVEFHPLVEGTEVVLTHERLPDDAAARAHATGWTRILDVLAREASTWIASSTIHAGESR
jgi:uncharacterized protein YndB with AHSA1/START domain